MLFTVFEISNTWYGLLLGYGCIECMYHYADLTKKHWAYKMRFRYILSSVRLSQFSQLSFMRCMGLCVFSILICLVVNLRICALYLIIIIRSEVRFISHCIGLLGVRSWNNIIGCMSCHILVSTSGSLIWIVIKTNDRVMKRYIYIHITLSPTFSHIVYDTHFTKTLKENSTFKQPINSNIVNTNPHWFI